MERAVFTYALNEEQKQLKEQITKELLKRKDIQEWLHKYHLNEKYIYDHSGVFQIWIEQNEICKACKGLFMCALSQKGYIDDLHADGQLFHVIKPCRYKKHELQVLSHQKQFLFSHMEEISYEIDLKQIDLHQETTDYKKIISIVSEQLLKSQAKGLFLRGKPGVGKTYLSMAIANYYAKEGKTCAFVNMPTFISDMKRMFQTPIVMEETLQKIKKADVIILDDIGGESVTNWSRDDILLPILDARLQSGKTTFFTSNYAMKELEARYAYANTQQPDSVAALRILERIQALSDEIQLKGQSRRY